MIITQDKDKNINFGNLVVCNKDGLKEVRDYFMQYRSDIDCKTYDYSIEKNLSSFSSILPRGYFRVGNTIVHNNICGKNSDLDGDVQCDYDREVYSCNYLNTILIATSLLGELDASNFDFIVKQFVGNGIIYCSNIDKVWPKCSKNMHFNKKETVKDLRVLRELLKMKIISYEIEEQYSKEKFNGVNFKNFHCQDLESLRINSDILLGKNSGFSRKKVK